MEERPIKVLLVEDNPDDVVFLRATLLKAKGARFSVEITDALATAIARANQGGIDVLLLDLSLSDSRGLDTFYAAQKGVQDVPIIVLSGLDDETIAVKAVHAGAQDYLVKGRVDSQLLSRAILYALERTQAREALLAAEQKFRSIFENAVEGIFQTSPDGKYLSANPALARFYGYDSPEELMLGLTDIGRLLYVEPDRRDEFVRLMQENDLVTAFESRVYRKDGRVIWISENVRSVRDAQGALLYYEGTVEDITERKKAQERLRYSEALYHSLVETLPQNIFRKDLNERFTFANRRFAETVGRGLEELLGKTDFDFFPPELARKYQHDDRRILETGETFEAVEEHRLPGSDARYVQVVKTPLYNAEGEVVGLQGIFWDITERKRAEERERKATAELARSQHELQQRNEMMEDDLRMAHEVQQAILPQQYPSFPPNLPAKESLLRFCHRYQPTGEVGGDFFNVLPLSDLKAGVFICDVMGHGVRSALITAMVRGLVEELRPVAHDPAELLSRLNRDLRAILQQTGTPLFTTAFYLVADLENHELLYANAGHPKPFLINHERSSVEVLANCDGKARPALGLFPDSTYTVFRRPLNRSDVLVLFTDGLYEIEAADGAQFSEELLLNLVKANAQLSCSDLFDLILKEIKQFSSNHRFADDVCLVGMQVADHA